MLAFRGLGGIEKEMGVAVALGAALEHEPGGRISALSSR